MKIGVYCRRHEQLGQRGVGNAYTGKPRYYSLRTLSGGCKYLANLNIYSGERRKKLRFRRDHRHTDGTPEDLNLYGGYATNNGTAFQQVFPADEYTCRMLQRVCDNEWIAEFSGNLSLFSYSLRKKGELVFKAEFDLTVPH